MFQIYVLVTEKTGRTCIGSTEHLDRRVRKAVLMHASKAVNWLRARSDAWLGRKRRY